MDNTGFLAPWLRDFGALTGLITGVVAVFKAYFEGRPFSYLEPDEVRSILKLYVLNTDKRSIVVNRFYILPRKRWYVAPNASLRHTIHSTIKHRLNVIIEPGKRHEFFLEAMEREAEPTWCLALMMWRPLGGLSLPRLPHVLITSRRQMTHLSWARKSNRDSQAE